MRTGLKPYDFSKRRAYDPEKHCGGKKRTDPGKGLPCTKAKGWGTDHVGEGRCRRHGGNNRITTGLTQFRSRYGGLKRPRIRELIEQFEKDPDPLNLFAELAAMRAHYTDFVERWEETSQALVAWWQSWSLSHRAWEPEEIQAFGELINDLEERIRTTAEEPTDRQTKALKQARSFLDALAKGENAGRPKQILDLADATRMLEGVAKVVERIERMRNSKVITQMELFRVMNQMGLVVKEWVKDPETAEAIILGWRDLLVQPQPRR